MRFEMGQMGCSAFTQLPESQINIRPIQTNSCKKYFTHDLTRIGSRHSRSYFFTVSTSKNLKITSNHCFVHLEKSGLIAVTSEITRNNFSSLQFYSEPVLIIT